MKRVNTDDIHFCDDYCYRFESQPFTGIGFELDSNGKLVSEMEFLNGIQHGTTRGYYTCGKVRSESEFRFGTRHGTTREWSEDGTLAEETEFELGICLRRRIISESGQLMTDYEIDTDSGQYEILQKLRNAKFIK